MTKRKTSRYFYINNRKFTIMVTTLLFFPYAIKTFCNSFIEALVQIKVFKPIDKHQVKTKENDTRTLIENCSSLIFVGYLYSGTNVIVSQAHGTT